MSYQKIVIVGHLGRDPELKYLDNGTAVANFSLATNRTYTTGSGQKVEETTWFRVTVWGRQAENVNQYLSSGRQALIEGRLNPDKDTGSPRVFARNDGSYGASYEVTADRVVFLQGGQGGQQGGQGGYEGGGYQGGGQQAEDDDLPF
jgi:single-strand DNA-binding protein